MVTIGAYPYYEIKKMDQPVDFNTRYDFHWYNLSIFKVSKPQNVVITNQKKYKNNYSNTRSIQLNTID